MWEPSQATLDMGFCVHCGGKGTARVRPLGGSPKVPTDHERRRKGADTPINVPIENRNQILWQKKLLIGCGGGCQQECGQAYSPVAEWMKGVDLVLEDERQQYGNMEEAASIARTPRTCLEVWSGDHRQTPGGLQKTKEAKAFRRKLIKRPLALRSQTKYIQPHGLAGVVTIPGLSYWNVSLAARSMGKKRDVGPRACDRAGLG